MSGENQKFTHITVESGDDDEFVIHAGVTTSEQALPEEDADLASSDAQEVLESGDTESEDPSCEEQVPSAVLVNDSSKSNDIYETKTEEDLQVPPMSTTQKAVIAFAIIMLIVGVVYYFGFLK